MIGKSEIQQPLEKQFNICHLVIEDLSVLHKGHLEARKSGGGHYRVLIVSDDFEGLPQLKRHRMVNDAVLKQVGSSINALGIRAFTSSEHAKQKAVF